MERMGWHANGSAWFCVTDVHRNRRPVICGVCKKFVKFQKIAKKPVQKKQYCQALPRNCPLKVL